MDDEVLDPFHTTLLKQNVMSFYANESLCDVMLLTEKKTIFAHKVVLASVSLYFRTHFTTNVGSGTDKSIIKFLEYDSESVEAVINFIYSGKICLTPRNVFNLMDIEELLQISNLRSIISTYLRTALNKINCWDILAKAEYYNYASLADYTFLYILENYKNLIRENEFSKIPYHILIKCLDSTVLNVPTEGVLLCSLVFWVMQDFESRKMYLEELLNRLKPSQIVSWNDAVAVATKRCEDEPEAMSILQPWIDRAQASRNKYIMTPRTHREIVVDALFAVGGHNVAGDCVSPMEINTNMPVNPWKLLLPSSAGSSSHSVKQDLELPPLPHPRHSHAHAYSIFSFYIIGGEDKGGAVKYVDKYDVVSNSWSACTPLPCSLTRSAAAYLDSCLFVAGGSDPATGSPLRNLLVLREGSQKWVELAPMSEKRCDHGLVATSGALYALGGQGVGGKLLCSVERYDPSTDTWMFVTPLHFPRRIFCSALVDNTIFVVGGELPTDSNEYNERYDVRTDVWRKWKMFKTSRCVFGGPLGRKVVVVSQSSGHSVQTYSTVSETTHDGGPALNHVRIGGSLIPLKLPLYRLLPI